MKQTIFTLLVFCAIGLVSCRKDKLQPTIKQYDQTQIQNYIASQGITGMVRDTAGGDTTGMYYKILNQGTGTPLQYTKQIAFVFTVRTFDGTYSSVDTINNHFFDYLGHVYIDKLPLGLQTALINDAKYAGTKMRILIPSHLAYGVDGYGSGSIQVANNRIGGNESLDYYVDIIDTSHQAQYDNDVIQSYMKNNNLTNFKQTADGLWYKVTIPGTNLTDPINNNSTLTSTYTTQLLNATVIDSTYNGTNYAVNPIQGSIPGVIEGLEKYATTGTTIDMLIPSKLAYGYTSQTGVPAFSCLRIDWDVISITP